MLALVQTSMVKASESLKSKMLEKRIKSKSLAVRNDRT